MSSPWDEFPLVDGQDEAQPAQQAMGRGAPKQGATPATAPAQPQGAVESWEEFEPAPDVPQVAGEIVSEEDSPAVRTQLSPEDEAEALRLMRAGDFDGAVRFLGARGFQFPNRANVQKGFEATGQVPDATYALPMPEERGMADAFGGGVADVLTFGLEDELQAFSDTLEDGVGNFGDRYNRNLDAQRGEAAYDQANNPGSRIAGQFAGAVALPSGLRGVGVAAGRAVLRAGGTIQEARTAAAAAIRNRMAVVGGGQGAAYGFGAADGDLGDRLEGAAKTGAVGYLGGQVVGAAGQVIAPRMAERAAAARAAPLTDGQQVMQAADRIGMDVLPADVGGPGTRRMTGAAAQAPLSASPVINAAQRVIDQGKAVRDRAVAAAGTSGDPEAAGEAAISGARKFMKRSSDRIGRIYDIAAVKAGDIKLPLTNARAELDEQIKRLEAVPGGGAGLAEARALRDALDGEFTVQGIRDMRTEMFVAPDFRGTPVERRLRRIVDAAALDIEQGLVAAGKTDAARAFATADKQWRERLTTLERVIEPIIGKGENRVRSGEEVMAGLTRASKGNAVRLRKFLDALPDGERGMVRATLIEQLGRATDGAQNAAGDAFSLGKFLTDWNKLSEGAKGALFGAESRAALNDLARVAQGTKEAQRYANMSNTSGGIWGNLGLLAGGATVSPEAAVAGGAAQLIGGRLLASPRFARWLARTPQRGNPEVHIERLGRIARAEPAIANEVFGLQQALRAVNDNAGRVGAAAASPDQRPDEQ